MRASFIRAIAVFLVAAAPGIAAAAPLAVKDVPEPLKPWVEWVLYGHENAKCPFLQGSAQQRQCLWPSQLQLSLHAKGGTFKQVWQVYKEDWISLPGDEKRWPQATMLNGASARVIRRGGRPAILVKPGRHTVSGSFTWDRLPELLQVPADTALLTLSVRERPVSFPVMDDRGQLWLQKTQTVAEGQPRMEIVVHRRVEDDIPLRLFTRVTLKVSGQSREVLLGRALPEGFVPMSLSAPLPARIEPDGRLRVQVRPGNWVLSLDARYEGPAKEITLGGEPGGPWDADEAWVFVSRDSYRLVSVEGVPGIDPQQTELPGDWRRFPAYLMHAGSTMRFAEKRRGDADPSADRLTLDRTFWLDFDGKGLSVQDKINGTLSRSWRLEVEPGTELGRAAVGGQDQFITALDQGGAAGIEVRQGQVNVAADSRLEGGVSSVPAVSWKHDFDKVSGRMRVPPGWQLIHAWGVDDASPTWINMWTLLDIFLLLIIALSVGRLWGWRWGLAAFAAAGVSWHEAMAPRWVWLFILAGEALYRALPEGKFLRWTKIYRWIVWLVLLLIVVPFFIVQVRNGLYPQLERTRRLWGWSPSAVMSMRAMDAAAPQEAALEEGDFELSEDAVSYERKSMRKARSKVQAMRGYSAGSLPGKPRMAQTYAPDPRSRVSTGPGLPNWSWREIALSWRGPVRAGQKMRLLWIPPQGNLLLAVLRIALILALAFGMLGFPVADWLKTLGGREGWRKLAKTVLPLLLLLAPPAAEAAKRPQENDTPPAEILQELRQRLLAVPECSPQCADSPRLHLSVTADRIEGRMHINAAAETAVPLPGGVKQWTPTTVLVDGGPAPGLMRSADGRLWLALAPGSHQILFSGPLPDRETLQLPLPLKSHRVEAAVSGWVLDGLHEDGQADDNLQLTRMRGRGAVKSSTLEPGNLPPFVRVERTLRLGLSWQVETRVIRMTPAGAAVVLEIPLLPGESVTSADVRTAEGKAQVSMSPQSNSVQWYSTLKESAEIVLDAPDSGSWVEVWRLDVSPIWNVTPAGIPAVHTAGGSGPRIREWRPWPGEKLTVGVRRPEGVPGQTLTFDSAALKVSPGIRATDATLELSMRSNRGGQHTITLPADAELQTVQIDGAAMPIRQDGRKVTLPIRPGSHSAQLTWRESRGIGLSYKTPGPDLGLPSVNTSITTAMPRDRWTLLLCGPALGPAVLFWSLLAVFLLVSVGLGKLTLTPLRARHWFLLFLGLTQVPVIVAAIVALWFLALGWRRKKVRERAREFNAVQIGLALLTAVAFICLFSSITKGLLGMPDMQISGNGSTAMSLQWYNDRSLAVLPRAWIFSVPLMMYRLAMLAWALWLASAMLGWIKWGWGCFTEGGYWMTLPPRVPAAGPVPPPAPKPEDKNNK
ncbi:MAG: hypothetical protein ABIJ96_06170 [Elusimicrobiota bacterium]